MSRLQPLQSADLDPQQSSRQSDGPDLLTQVQVCARLGISDETWRRWRKAQRTPEAVTMPSGRLKWRVSDVDALAGRPVEHPTRRFYFNSARRRHAETVSRGTFGEKGNPVAVTRGVR